MHKLKLEITATTISTKTNLAVTPTQHGGASIASLIVLLQSVCAWALSGISEVFVSYCVMSHPGPLLLSLFLPIPPLPGPFVFTHGPHTGPCQLDNPRYTTCLTTFGSLAFYPLEYNFDFSFQWKAQHCQAMTSKGRINLQLSRPCKGKSKNVICSPKAGPFPLHYVSAHPLPGPSCTVWRRKAIPVTGKHKNLCCKLPQSLGD